MSVLLKGMSELTHGPRQTPSPPLYAVRKVLSSIFKIIVKNIFQIIPMPAQGFVRVLWRPLVPSASLLAGVPFLERLPPAPPYARASVHSAVGDSGVTPLSQLTSCSFPRRKERSRC
jgi:hypothetical protein